MSNTHTAVSRTDAVSNDRYQVGGVNLPASQITNIPAGLKVDTVIIPSSSVPAFGSYFTCDIKEVGYIHDLKLQFNVSALTATGGASNRLVPAIFWATRIEIVQNSQVIDTIYPVQQWVINQIIQADEDRIYTNQQMGLYSNTTLRATKASTAGDWFVPLKTFFNETNLPILTSSHNVQLRVYMDTLANVYAGGGTAPVCSINFCNVIASITRIPTPTANSLLNSMMTSPQQSIMHDTRYGTFNVAAGVSSTTIVLTPIVGKVACLFFVVRTVGSTTGDSAFSFNNITSFAILNSSSTNIVGGQNISSQLSLNVLGQYNCASSYLTETAFGATNNGAHVYIHSFSTDILSALTAGKALSSYDFTGNEQLQIVFTAALGTAVTVDVFTANEAMITQTPNSITKTSF